VQTNLFRRCTFLGLSGLRLGALKYICGKYLMGVIVKVINLAYNIERLLVQPCRLIFKCCLEII
jgi:hypothetical protein